MADLQSKAENYKVIKLTNKNNMALASSKLQQTKDTDAIQEEKMSLEKLLGAVRAHVSKPIQRVAQFSEANPKSNEISDEPTPFNNLEEWVEALEEKYGATDSGGLEQQTKLPVSVVEHNYPLHYAVYMGNFALVHDILSTKDDKGHYKYDINAVDNLNSTALHVAVITHQTQIADYLVHRGIEINALAYESYDAFSMAVFKGYYDIAQILIQQPDLMIDQFTMMMCLDRLDLLFNDEGSTEEFNLFQCIDKAFEDPKNNKLSQDKIDELKKCLDLIEAVAAKMHPAVIEIEDLFGTDLFPVATFIDLASTFVKDSNARELMEQTFQKINLFDNSHEILINAKLLTHIFPLEGEYEINFDNTHNLFFNNTYTFSSEGLFGTYTLQTVRDYLLKYVESKNNVLAEEGKNIAANVVKAISDAHEFSRAFQDETILDEMYQKYLNGEILYLPTGWDGHFVVNIIDPNTGLFVSSNTGMAYEGLESGSIIYKIHNPENITAEIIGEIANNEDQFFLEYDLHYELGLEKLFVLEQSEQEVGNCAWRSAEVGVEALGFLSLVEQGYDFSTAKDIIHSWHTDWVQFTQQQFLSDYLSQDAHCDIQVLNDILLNQNTLFDQDLEVDPNQLKTANQIVNAFTTNSYLSEFYKISSNFIDAKSELKDMFASLNLEISPTEQLAQKLDDLNIVDNLGAELEHESLPESISIQAINKILQVQDVFTDEGSVFATQTNCGMQSTQLIDSVIQLKNNTLEEQPLPLIEIL